MKHYVYLTTNLINSKQYIGDRSCKGDPEKDKYLGSGLYFQKAERFYKKENFSKQILEYFETRELAFNAQKMYIEKYNTLSPNGYNLSPTGGLCVGGHQSEETKKKISVKNSGKKRSELSKQNIKNSLIGRSLSETHKNNLSISHIGKLKGRARTQETKEKIKTSWIKRKQK